MHREIEQDADEDMPVELDAQSGRQAKVSKACLPCRNTKTKCVAMKGSSSCMACVKKSRPCITAGPTKPRFKSSEKIRDLEMKIESLTDALATRTHHDEPVRSTTSAPTAPSTATQNAPYISQSSQNVDNIFLQASNSKTLFPRLRVTDHSSQPYLDVIDRGLIDFPTAEVLFNHWNVTMRPMFPFLSSYEISVREFKITSRILFLAILTVASASILPSLQPQLTMELNEQLATHIFIKGIQSVELVQATLLYSQYYIRSSESQNSAPTQFVWAAFAMLCDLEIPDRLRRGSTAPNEEVIEAARMCMISWYSISSNASLLHQQTPILPPSEVETCISILSSAASSSPSDLLLCSIARLQLILHDVLNILEPQGSEPSDLFENPTLQYKIQMFQRRLQNWSSSVPPFFDDRLRRYALEFANVYIRQVVLRRYNRQQQQQQQSSGRERGKQNKDISSNIQLVDCICRCLESSQAVVDIYLSFENSMARSLPNNFLIWTVYAAISLIKLTPYREALRDEGTARTIPDTSALAYLEAMIKKISDITADGYLPQAISCGTALVKLRLWCMHKRQICLNSRRGCEAEPDEPIYSVFGDEPETASVALNTSTTKSTSGSSQPRDVGSGAQMVQITSLTGEHGSLYPPEFNPSMIQTSTMPNVTTGQINSAPDVTMDDFTALTSTEPRWDDFLMDSEALREFDDFMMNNDTDSWLRGLL